MKWLGRGMFRRRPAPDFRDAKPQPARIARCFDTESWTYPATVFFQRWCGAVQEANVVKTWCVLLLMTVTFTFSHATVFPFPLPLRSLIKTNSHLVNNTPFWFRCCLPVIILGQFFVIFYLVPVLLVAVGF
jgi:hypothetical protein